MALLQRTQTDPNCKVWVGRLAFSTTPESLGRHMAHAGLVVDCGVLGVNGTTDGSSRSRCSGFVSYSNPSDASKAIALLDGTMLDGRSIWVDRWTNGWNPADAALKGDLTQPRWTNPKVEFRGESSASNVSHAATSELDGLEKQLRCIMPTRASICKAMVFCLDNGSQHAPSLARRIVKALVEPGLAMELVVARLFLVSDVLFNSNSGASGAEKFRNSFQELLPDAFEKLGRLLLRRAGLQHIEQAHAENVVRRILTAWQDWSVFPPLFTRGLEALLFAPVLDAVPPHVQKDLSLQQKVSRWQSTVGAERFPYEARMRGLAGSTLRTSTCRSRLCHYEIYWHRLSTDASDSVLGEASLASNAMALSIPCELMEDDIDGESLDESDIMYDDI